MKNKKALLASLILAVIAGQAVPFSKMGECHDIIRTFEVYKERKLTVNKQGFTPSGIYKNQEFLYPDVFGVRVFGSYIVDKHTNICIFSQVSFGTCEDIGGLFKRQHLGRLFLGCKSMFETQQSWDHYLDKGLKGMKIICSKEVPIDFNRYQKNKAKRLLKSKVEELNITQDLESLSGIKVHNKPEGGVELSREGGQSIDFQAALEKYIKKFGLSFGEANGEIGNAITDENGTAEAIKNLLFSSKVPYDRDALPLLKDSRILTVFHLLKTTLVNAENKEEKKTVNQRMFGFAADKEGKVFAWSTDLGQDIEVLYDFGISEGLDFSQDVKVPLNEFK